MGSLAGLQVLQHMVDSLLKASRRLGLAKGVSIQGIKLLGLEQVGDGKSRGARAKAGIRDDVYKNELGRCRHGQRQGMTDLE